MATQLTEADVKKVVATALKAFDKRLKAIETQVKTGNFESIKTEISVLKTGLNKVAIDVAKIMIATTPIDIDKEFEEFDNPISEADYYARYPFVKQHQDIHGGTAWENYQNPGKADGRTWQKIKMSDLKLTEIKINESFN